MYAATSGYRNDGDAGLSHVGARYYDAQVGRFISRDTFLDQKPYLYCNHDPINNLDPTGHSATDGSGGSRYGPWEDPDPHYRDPTLKLNPSPLIQYIQKMLDNGIQGAIVTGTLGAIVAGLGGIDLPGVPIGAGAGGIAGFVGGVLKTPLNDLYDWGRGGFHW